MGQSSNTLHESTEVLSPETVDKHRATVSLMEELEAADWYDQRAQACSDDELRKILIHNRDEEKEHAAMVLEWLRSKDSALDEHLRHYLFQDKSPIEIEAADKAAKAAGPKPASEQQVASDSLGIGSLRRKIEAP